MQCRDIRLKPAKKSLDPTSSRHSKRIVAVAVALFLLFDFTALALNFWLSWKIERQAIDINLAGRQRMLSQRMVKSLLQIEDARRNHENPAVSLAELKLTFDLFDNTLQGFAHGSKTRGGANEEMYLQPVNGERAIKIVDQAISIWLPYRSQVQTVIGTRAAGLDQALPEAITSAKQNNLELLRLMNELTTELEQLTQAEAKKIRIYQGAAFVIALFNFFLAVWLNRRRIRTFNRSRDLLDDIINKVSASVLVQDESGAIIKANHTAEKMFGYDKGGMVGLHLDDLVKGEEDSQLGQRKDGTTFLTLMERNETALGERSLFIVTVLDITAQRMTEEHLSSLAYHDLLTKLPNRLLFDDRLRQGIVQAQRRELILAVIFIDLDHFKPVNDTYGHEVGDLLLQDVAVRLKRCLRESDTVSRRGGDEFTVIATDIGNHLHCEKIAEVILSQLTRPFHIGNLELKIGASIGISLFPNDGNDAGLLVSRADEAMYQAKQAGRGTFRFYSDASESFVAMQLANSAA